MQKYKLIVADTTNPAYSKMSATVAQHLAVSFGYPLRKFDPGPGEVLVFDPNTNEAAISNRAFVKSNVVVAFTAEFLIGALEKPEMDVITIEDASGEVNASIFNDTITFRSKTSHLIGTVTVPKTFIKKVLGLKIPRLEHHQPGHSPQNIYKFSD